MFQSLFLLDQYFYEKGNIEQVFDTKKFQSLFLLDQYFYLKMTKESILQLTKVSILIFTGSIFLYGVIEVNHNDLLVSILIFTGSIFLSFFSKA